MQRSLITAIALAPILLMLFYLLVIPMIYDIRWYFISSAYFKDVIERRGLPGNTLEIARWSGISGPYSSNYCSQFAGVLLETNLKPIAIRKYYKSVTNETRFRPIVSLVTAKHFYWGPGKYDLNYKSSYPRGIRKLTDGVKLRNKGKNKHYLIVFIIDNFTSNWNIRCH